MKEYDSENVCLVKGYDLQMKRHKFPRMNRCDEMSVKGIYTHSLEGKSVYL